MEGTFNLGLLSNHRSISATTSITRKTTAGMMISLDLNRKMIHVGSSSYTLRMPHLLIQAVGGRKDRFETKAAKYYSNLTVRRPYDHDLQESSPVAITDIKKKMTNDQVIIDIEEEAEKGRRSGKYGEFGGKFVPETLMTCLTILEAEFNLALHDSQFQEELSTALRDYVGRETPLYYAKRLSDYYRAQNAGVGPDIYLKREDLSYGGAHKMNNAIAQAMLAKRLGKKNVIAATGAGQHGLATAAACAKLSLDCTVFMGTSDIERQSSNVVLMKLLGAQVEEVAGNFKDATSEAFRAWVGDLENSYYLTGTVVGPHPSPLMVREFQSVIGKETRRQAMDRWGGKPDILLACVGTGSNALGLFHEFVQDEEVRLIGIEAAGFGLDSGKHSATLVKGEVGVYHGAMSYLLQDDEGQIISPHSVGVGLEYPGVAPELSYLKETERAEFYAVTDQEAIHAYKRLCKLEGIIPALEASHALAYLEKLCPELPDGTKVVVSLSGRGDKDSTTVFRHSLMEQWQPI